MKHLLWVLLLVAHSVIAAEDVGRLFTTPAERDALDRLRQNTRGQMLEQIPTPEVTETTPAVSAAQRISVQGFVRRSDGNKSTVWINHQPLQENSESGSVRIGKLTTGKNTVSITLPDQGRSISLKAGQSYDPASGGIIENNVHAQPAQENSARVNGAEEGTIR
ncbi:hypothetical protein LG201_09560 [Methylobacillus gramineus]|uniref:hypothetical protein n=1 Tax=Methylobacillus gramineus TaxID=755169 RepID=UPI001CFFB62E|nr:hypothetical protein [Methylobacillus gramineus]MCB5185446.1 hypothetical protein [Methylobacillus gramineus]